MKTIVRKFTSFVRRHWSFQVAFSVVAILAFTAPSAQAVLTTSNLRCEYLTNPTGIDEVSPRLSWIVNSSTRGERQTAYEIIVASTSAILAGNQGDLWESGQVSSDAMAQIVYSGTALTSREACYWKVRSWNQSGVVSAWSSGAIWTMGLLQATDWSAQWIDGMIYGSATQTAAPTIVSATFEATTGSGSLNVTSQIAALAAAGNRLITVSVATFGSDPAPNVVKQLRVMYQRSGPTLTKIFPEKSLVSLPADLPAQPTNLVITSAHYGAISGTGNYVDDTNKLNSVAAGGPFSVVVNNNNFGPDPAAGQAKQLTIVYTINGATGAVNIPENSTFNYPVDLATPVPANVTAATYEAFDGNASVDVTAKLAALVQNGVYTVTVNNATLNGGVDPAVNQPKRLRIAYNVNGVSSMKYVYENNTFSFPSDLRLPENVAYLRKSFTPAKQVQKATLYATALGTYELQLNGSRISDQFFAPGWTTFGTRVRYQAYDVTSQLVADENVLGAQVSGDWYSGHIGNGGYQVGGMSRALLAQLEIVYSDGTTDRFVTDSSWKMHASPTVYSDLMGGEEYDARSEIAGWASPGFDASSWSPVLVRTEAARIMNSQASEPIRDLGELTPVSVTAPQAGRWTYDLGQNISGVIRLQISAPAGTVITIRHAEVLNLDGTIYTNNYRRASARDTYVCKGGSVETWQPKFTYRGFRYVELTGPSTQPPLSAVTGVVLGSNTPFVGQLSTSDPSLDRLQSNIQWGQMDNYFSVPTDCPQRDERLGWMGDAEIFIRTASYNADVAAFFTKWMVDVNDSQVSGAYTDISPYNNAGAGSPAWADAGVICPWMIYQMYGDTRILAKCYPYMVAWVQLCQSNSVNYIRSGNRGSDFGDYLAPDGTTSKELIGTAFFAHSADLLARTATVLGYTNDAATYQTMFQNIKTAYNNAYVNQNTGVCTSPTQCAYALALDFNLVSDSLKPLMAQLIANDVASRSNHLSVGFVGVDHLLPSLSNNGGTTTAYNLIQQTTYPSWLYEVNAGATTVWERWDGIETNGSYEDPEQNSFNHYAFGSCGEWLYDTVAGIDIDPTATGYRKFIIHPQSGGTVTSASASYASMSGAIACNWSSGNGGFLLNVVIPANTTATVYVPTTDASQVLESDGSASSATGVTFVGMSGGSAVYTVQSGSYSFAVQGHSVPGTDSITRNSVGQAQVSISSLLANDGANAVFLSVSPTSVHGAQVSVVNGNIVYQPQADFPGNDSFTYTIRNAQGGVTTETVYVAAMTGPDTALKSIGASSTPGGPVRVQFTGVPYRSYRVQSTTTLTDPSSWINYSTVQAASDGSFEVDDPQPLPVKKFYRAQYP